MDAKNADLAALRINRSTDAAGAGSPLPRRSRLWLAIGLPAAAGVVVVAALVITGGALTPALPVRLTPATLVSPMRAGAVLVASGYVVAQRKAAVASKGTGRLVYLGVVEGDRVRAGQVIARIEDGDVKAQLAQAQANVQVNRAELQDAERSLARERLLSDSGFSSQANLDAASARYQRVKAGIAAAEAAVEAAQVALENTVIRAPFDGTVLTKNADVGEVVAPLAASAFSKSAVVTIADLGSLEVEADVAESNLEAISVGQPCEIVLDAYPDVRYPGRVAKIVPTADRAKATVQVKVAFRSYDARVLPEMSAKVHFLPRPARAGSDTASVLVVPASAVVERGSQAVVYVVRDGRAVERPVTVGRQVGSGVAIRDGLTAGIQVIDSVSDRVRGGARVRVE